jgi:oligopeptide transport system permease protein
MLKTMFRFLLTKFLRAITILVSVTLIIFLLIHATEGNLWQNFSSDQRRIIGVFTDTSVIDILNHHFGLDLPLWRQFTRYVIGDFNEDGSLFCGAICGNLGPSISQGGRSVQDIIFGAPQGLTFWESRFGYSIRLVLFGLLIVVGIGIPLGIWSATKPGMALSHTISIGLTVLISIPNFVLGLLAIIVLGSWLKITKVIPDWNNPSNWIIPVIVLAAIPMANFARVTRASLINILNEDYIRTARGKGLTETRVMLMHVMPNVLVPIIIFLGQTFMEMFTGLLIVENLYAFPGFGRGFWDAVLKLDYPMIMGLTLIYASGILLVNILTEFVCEILDPRIHSIKQQGAP